MGPIFARGESKLMQRLLVILRSFPCKCCIVWVGVIHSPLISFLQAEKKFRNPKTPTNLKRNKGGTVNLAILRVCDLLWGWWVKTWHEIKGESWPPTIGDQKVAAGSSPGICFSRPKKEEVVVGFPVAKDGKVSDGDLPCEFSRRQSFEWLLSIKNGRVEFCTWKPHFFEMMIGCLSNPEATQMVIMLCWYEGCPFGLNWQYLGSNPPTLTVANEGLCGFLVLKI